MGAIVDVSEAKVGAGDAARAGCGGTGGGASPLIVILDVVEYVESGRAELVSTLTTLGMCWVG